MRGALEACAVSRAALRRCAGARPSLCLASALMRATAATLLHRLRAYLGRSHFTHLREIRARQWDVPLRPIVRTMGSWFNFYIV